METTTVHDAPRPPRARRKVAKRFEAVADDVLLRRTREGDVDAYGELYRRHSKAAFVAARSFGNLDESDDVVSEAFATIYEALSAGGGPTGAFRPYLYVIIRNTVYQHLRGRGSAVDSDLDSLVVASAHDPVQAAFKSTLTTTAFRSLPERWQTVLWYTEVERMTPRQAGELMGLRPNAISALAFRARAALREAWVVAHVTGTPTSGPVATGIHLDVQSRLGGWSLGTLSQRQEHLVSEHLATCTRCRLVAEELEDASSRLALILLPLILGGTAALMFERQLTVNAGSVTAASSGFHVAALLDPARRGWLALAVVVVIASAGVVLVNALVSAAPVGPVAHHRVAVASGPTRSAGGSSGQAAAVLAPQPAATPRPFLTPPPVTPEPVSRGRARPPLPTPVDVSPAPFATSGPVMAADAPVLTSPRSVITRASSTIITGTAPKGSAVVVAVAGSRVTDVDVTTAGSWSWTATHLAEGRTVFMFTTSRRGENLSAATSVVVTRDSVAPQPPVVTSSASPTQLTPCQLTGTAEPGSLVTIESASGIVLATVRTSSSGTWSTGTIAGFTPAMSSLVATATDEAGNVSAPTTIGPFGFEPVFSDPPGQQFSTPTVSIDLQAWAGSTVAVTVNGVSQGNRLVPTSGALTLTAETGDGSPLAAGNYTVTATYTDGTTTSTATASWTFSIAVG